MAELNRADLKAFFETGDKPTEAQFADLIDSLFDFVDDVNKLIAFGRVTFASTTIPEIINDSDSDITFTIIPATNNLHMANDGGAVSFLKSYINLHDTFSDIGFNHTFIDLKLNEMIFKITNVSGVSFFQMLRFKNDAGIAKMAFFDTPEVAQPSAIPNTSGATLAQLETEVNKVKDAIRDLGLIAP